jgi:hypothetical protein
MSYLPGSAPARSSLPDDGGPRRGESRLRPLVWGGAAFLLSLPLLAMRFTSEVNWTGSDFVVFGTMLLVACGCFELGVRLSASPSYRAGFNVAVGTGFLLVWANLAVGFIGSEDNPANLMFFGVLLIGLVGAALARFRARGMAVALAVTAVAQLSASVIGWVGAMGDVPLVPTVVFTGAWGVSAALFRLAAR